MSASDRDALLDRLQALDLTLMQASVTGSLRRYRALLRERQWVRACLERGRLEELAA